MAADIVLASDSGGGAALGEHVFKKTLGGDPATARDRVSAALEQLGYEIVSDEPFVAKKGRSSRGMMSTTVIEHARTVTLRIKTIGSGAVTVTFNYVGYPLNQKGGKAVIQREAEALIALASPQLTAAVCSTCGGDTRGDSRYCHNCGAPAGRRPAELEVMRISDQTHQAAVQVAVASASSVLGLLVFGLVLGIKGIASLTAASIFAGLFLIPAAVCMFYAMRHLNRALTLPAEPGRGGEAPVTSATQFQPTHSPASISAETFDPASITEDTTAHLRLIAEDPSERPEDHSKVTGPLH